MAASETRAPATARVLWPGPGERGTALLTGASGGLGAEFARQLAGQGWRLVLVGRSADTLDALAAQLPAEVEPLIADLAEPAGMALVEHRLADPDRPVDLLVNNAGVLGRIAPLAEQTAQSQDHLVDLDVRAVVRLCRAALPGMVARRRGGLLNVSSVMAFLPAPQGATYAAGKAFVNSLSESLHSEVRQHGVRVTVVCPGSVRTGLHRSSGRGGGRLGPFLDPAQVVAESLAALAAGRPLCVPGSRYRMIARLSRLAPRRAVHRWVDRRFGR